MNGSHRSDAPERPGSSSEAAGRPGSSGSPKSAQMTSDEVNAIVYGYLVESGLTHSSFSLYNESLASKSLPVCPQGQLVRILQKGLLYLEAEARYRGEDTAARPPRLLGYTIPDALPIPQLPKSHSPTPSTSTQLPPPAGSKRKDRSASPPAPPERKDDTAKRAKTDTGKGKARAVDQDGDAVMATSAPMLPSKSATSDTGKARPNGRRQSTPKSQSPAHDDAPKRRASAAMAKSKSASSDLALPNPLPKVRADLTFVNPAHPPPPKLPSSNSDPMLGKYSLSRILDSASANDDSSLPAPNGVKMELDSAPVDTPAPDVEEGELEPPKSASLDKPTLSIQSDTPKSAALVPSPTTQRPDPTKTNTASVKTIPSSSISTLTGHERKVNVCHWNPKVPNMLATGAVDGTARIFDVAASLAPEIEASACIKHNSGGSRKADVQSVQWNPEGTLLATGTVDGVVRIWTPSGDLHLVLSMHKQAVFSIKWNAKGTMLITASADRTVCLWELSTGKVRQQWEWHSDAVVDVDWLDDTHFADCSSDSTVFVYSLNKMTPLLRLKGHTDEVNCIKFDPSKRYLASGGGSEDMTIRCWGLKQLRLLQCTSVHPESNDSVVALRGHTDDVHAIAWHPNTEVETGQPHLLASASHDGTSRIWDVSTRSCLHIVNLHSEVVYSLAFQPKLGEYLATASQDGSVCIVRVKDNVQTALFKYQGSVLEMDWHSNRPQLAIVGSAGPVNVLQVDQFLQ